MNPRLSFRALGEPGTRRVPVREPCDPESMPGSAPAERWIPDSAVCRAGFLRNPGQTGFRNDEQKRRRFHMQLPCLRRLPALCRIVLCALALSIAVSLGGAFPAAPQVGNILVFAAASLRNALDDVNAQWRKDNGQTARIKSEQGRA